MLWRDPVPKLALITTFSLCMKQAQIAAVIAGLCDALQRKLQQEAEEVRAPRPDPAPDYSTSKGLKEHLLLSVVSEMIAGRKEGWDGV